MKVELSSADDEAFLDELLELAVVSCSRGETLDLEDLLPDREHLRAQVAEILEMARDIAVAAPPRLEKRSPIRLPGLTVLDEIGRGGTGIVYRARQEALGRIVALKVLAPALVASSHSRERFLREAQALGRVRHPHVIAVHDVFVDENLCAFTMEWIDGGTLARAIAKSKEGLEAAHVARLGVQIARALEAVHAVALVHRDVKPSNVLLRIDGSPVLGDFGLARDQDGTVHTATGEFLGTAAYAAPEQLRGEHADVGPWSDVYSLGVTLYVALAGQTPFGKPSTSAEVLRRIETGQNIPLRRLNPRVPRDLATILAKALDRDPARRYPMARDFAEDLERLLRFEPIHARPAGLVLRLHRWMERSPHLALALFALMITLAVGTAVSLSLALHLASQSEDLRRTAESEHALRVEADEQREAARTQTARVKEQLELQSSLVAFFQSVFGFGDPSLSTGRTDRTLRDALELASKDVFKYEHLSRPEVAFAVHSIVLETLLPFGLQTSLEAHVRQVEILRDQVCPPLSEAAAKADYQCARFARLLGRIDDAKCLFERCVRVRRILGGANARWWAQALTSLGHTHRAIGELDEAERCHAEAMAIYIEQFDNRDDNVGIVAMSLSKLAMLRGDLQRADELALESVSVIARFHAGSEHLDLANTFFQLGQVRYARGARSEGESLMRQALEMMRATAGPHHRYSVELAMQLGALLLEAARTDEAVTLFEAAFAAHHVLDSERAAKLAEALLALERADRAEEVLRPWIEVEGEARARAHRWHLYGKACTRLARYEEARKQLEAARSLCLELSNAEAELAATHGALVALYEAWLDAEESEATRQGLERWRRERESVRSSTKMDR